MASRRRGARRVLRADSVPGHHLHTSPLLQCTTRLSVDSSWLPQGRGGAWGTRYEYQEGQVQLQRADRRVGAIVGLAGGHMPVHRNGHWERRCRAYGRNNAPTAVPCPAVPVPADESITHSPPLSLHVPKQACCSVPGPATKPQNRKIHTPSASGLQAGTRWAARAAYVIITYGMHVCVQKKLRSCCREVQGPPWCGTLR